VKYIFAEALALSIVTTCPVEKGEVAVVPVIRAALFDAREEKLSVLNATEPTIPSTPTTQCEAEDIVMPVGGTRVVVGSVTVKNTVLPAAAKPTAGSLQEAAVKGKAGR
jgi:hypothetical protein